MEKNTMTKSKWLPEPIKTAISNTFEKVRTSGEFKHLCIQNAVRQLGGYGRTMQLLDYLQVQGRMSKQEKSDIRKLINTAFSEIEDRENRRYGIE